MYSTMNLWYLLLRNLQNHIEKNENISHSWFALRWVGQLRAVALLKWSNGLTGNWRMNAFNADELVFFRVWTRIMFEFSYTTFEQVSEANVANWICWKVKMIYFLNDTLHPYCSFSGNFSGKSELKVNEHTTLWFIILLQHFFKFNL